jgi:hypothetical protein
VASSRVNKLVELLTLEQSDLMEAKSCMGSAKAQGGANTDCYKKAESAVKNEKEVVAELEAYVGQLSNSQRDCTNGLPADVRQYNGRTYTTQSDPDGISAISGFNAVAADEEITQSALLKKLKLSWCDRYGCAAPDVSAAAKAALERNETVDAWASELPGSAGQGMRQAGLLLDAAKPLLASPKGDHGGNLLSGCSLVEQAGAEAKSDLTSWQGLLKSNSCRQ